MNNDHIEPDPDGEQKFTVTDDGLLRETDNGEADFEEDLTFDE